MTTVYVPCDSAARAVGADEVAAAIEAGAQARGVALRVVRNGSRGLFWLEPLVEVQTAQGRVAYGPVAPEDVPGLFDAGFLDGGAHALRQGITEQIPFLALQERLTFRRMGITDPLSLDDYQAHEGWQGLTRALQLGGEAVVDEVAHAGLPVWQHEVERLAELARIEARVGGAVGGCRVFGRADRPDCRWISFQGSA
mgnify:CR=1 FL=1